MTSYTEQKSKRIIDIILEVLKRSDTDIDNTVTVSEIDIQDVLDELKITNFNFNYVAALKKRLQFEGYKIMYKDTKILKVERDNSIHLNENDFSFEYK
ncbi:hypothetical protein EZS27_000004 [termite gut metagenome]|uniref:Uncharacterized protein n=1 Tax=termite gut metagenome TaxID=433724 RepID=A0A5J4T3N5_9ZZZZ